MTRMNPELNENINRTLTMLQTGIGVDDQGTTYNELKALEKQVMADVKSGKLAPEKAFQIAAEVRKQLTTEGLQRFDAYMNEKAAVGNLNTLVDNAADNRASAQSGARTARQLAVAALRNFEGPPSELLSASQHITELEGRGTLDTITAASMRQAIDTRLAEEAARNGLGIAPPPQVWHAFIDSHAQRESSSNMSARAVQVQPRDVLLHPDRFAPALRATLSTGRISLSEIGRLSNEAAVAQQRGTLSSEGRNSINRAIDANLKNANGVLDPASAVSRQSAVTAAREGDVVQRVLGATPAQSADAVAGPTTQAVAASEASSREARARLATPLTVSNQVTGVSVAARAIDAAQRPTAPNASQNESPQERTFDFADPKLAQQFVHALTKPGKVSAGQRAVLVDSVLQKGALSLGELRAFQIALDDAAHLGLVTAQESQQAWRVVASEAAKHVGGSTIAARVQEQEISRHGLQRFRG